MLAKIFNYSVGKRHHLQKERKNNYLFCPHGKTPLTYAVKLGRIEIVKALLSVPGIDVNAPVNFPSLHIGNWQSLTTFLLDGMQILFFPFNGYFLT